ncbi:MAG: cation-translocating P-type ATPase [Clostridiales bacterium]|nr:cation-translocating P-type ATPase [Clostridiales bacterium]
MMDTKTAEETAKELQTDLAAGLSEAEAKERLASEGPNELTEKKPKSKLAMFLSQLNDPMIYILFAAAAISLWQREATDAAIVLVVVLLNAVIGTVQEAKAQQSLDALKKMSAPNCLVRRGGALREIPARELVRGDVVLLEAGRTVPADLRLVLTVNLKIEESALTGESVPAEKDASYRCAAASEGGAGGGVSTGTGGAGAAPDTGVVPGADVGIGDRQDMAFSSTAVAYGRGEGIVVRTGMATEIGKIAKILSGEKEELTPLQKKLAGLGKMLGITAVVICAAMMGVALLQRRDFDEMLLTAISLAVAAIPEGLPAVVTIVLAMGVGRMVKVNTIVRKLPSVETLGAVSVVCSDKTGTLTQNKMTVQRVYQNGETRAAAALDRSADALFLRGFVLCNDASAQGARMGDPTELALLDMGAPLGFVREELEKTYPRVNELAFDSDRKLMTTVHEAPDGTIEAFTKGAMDNILDRSVAVIGDGGAARPITESDKQNIASAAKAMASDALRVLGLAVKYDGGPAGAAVTEEGLTFVGLAGMIDPPRKEAKNSVEVFRGAGIRTIMITGDHRDTAFAIAKELGIAENENQCLTGGELHGMAQEELNRRVPDLRVFARVSPEHKVMIVRAFQSHGYIVSMTGDGVNDAPSLKAADIGVAMGITGTDVAKGAADMVLTDDNFSSIEKAVAEGRTIYANIKKTVMFLLSSNFGEVFCMFAAIVSGLASPLRAIHILWVNLITDTLPGLALGADPGDKSVMAAKPRGQKEGLFSGGGLALTLGYGLLIAVLTLAAFLIEPVRAVGFELSAVKEWLAVSSENLMLAQTYAFMTLAASQIFHSIGMRNTGRSVFKMNHTENKLMLVSLVVGLGLQIALTEIPALNAVFGTSRLGLSSWGLILALSIVPLIVHEVKIPLVAASPCFVLWNCSKITYALSLVFLLAFFFASREIRDKKRTGNRSDPRNVRISDINTSGLLGATGLVQNPNRNATQSMLWGRIRRRAPDPIRNQRKRKSRV